MAATYTLIASNVLSSATTTITFSSIPSTYTDLVLKFTARTNYPSQYVSPVIRFNGDTGNNYSYTLASNNNNSKYTQTLGSTSNIAGGSYVVGSTATTSTFGSYEMYIPSYTVSQNKPVSGFAVAENNSATVFDLQVDAMLYSSTNAINSISISIPSYTFDTGSSFYLYGIKNA